MLKHITTFLISLFYFILTVGLLCTLVTEAPYYIRSFVTKFCETKEYKRAEENKLKSLSVDTQIIIKQYMKPINYYGKRMYAISDTTMFDFFIQNHIFESSDRRNPWKIDDAMRDGLATGSAFIIFVNGEEYVAMKRIE